MENRYKIPRDQKHGVINDVALEGDAILRRQHIVLDVSTYAKYC